MNPAARERAAASFAVPSVEVAGGAAQLTSEAVLQRLGTTGSSL
jgi:hypothetical protein